MGLEEFRKRIIKATKKKVRFKVTNSNGTKEAWRWIKKNKWLNIGQPITELQLGTIIKAINNTLQDQLLEGKDVVFPNRMGRLEIRRYKSRLEYKDDKITTNLPIDWKRTTELWWEDEESRNNKTLVRFEGINRFKIYYNKVKAIYPNKSFYQFIPTRTIRKKLKNCINNKGFDALLLGKRNELY